MERGERVADRFEVEAEIGRGGMGTVYRARDLHSDTPVALKLLSQAALGERGRFEREAAVLSRIEHAHVVRYVAHGEVEGGVPFLAMEWIDGNDLSKRLERGRLLVADAVVLARRVAEALSASHALGVVHRDIKPANLLLPGDDPRAVKVLDFGIAYLSNTLFGERTVTRSGVLVGTPSFMSPEQVRGRELGPRADLFSLGAVLHNCLCGTPPFGGDELMAVLAKVLFEPAPRLSTLMELPEELELLVVSMLAKDPAARPHSAQEVAERLAALDEGRLSQRASNPARSSVLTEMEMRYVGIVLGRHADAAPIETDETWVPSARGELRVQVSRIARRFGARAEVMADGSLVAVAAQAPTARETAKGAVRLALALEQALPGGAFAAIAGRSVVTDDVVLGGSLDHAARLVRGAQPGSVLVDAETRSLLADEFDLTSVREGVARVDTERRGADGTARTLLGRATPCVGRRKELSLLVATYEECLDEGLRLAVVLGGAGVGKTRLVGEALAQLSTSRDAPRVLRAQGDALAAGAWAGLADLLAASCGVPDDASAERIRSALDARLAAIGVSDPAVFALLGDLLGATPSEVLAPGVQEARRDPLLMSERLSDAARQWLRAEAASGPVVAALDDAQSVDRATLEWVDHAAHALRDSPILFVVITRTLDDDAHSLPLRTQERVELRLGNLSRRACHDLVRHALRDADDTLVESLTERSEGNAFFLEELIRSAESGETELLPDSVLGTVEARLSKFTAQARRVLRAASVIGPTFWPSAVAALLGGAAPDGGALDIVEQLHLLEAAEVLSREARSTREGESEWSFRNALVREASYAMLTAEDRERGHRRAAEWLERTRERDPAVIAAHWVAGGAPERAAAAYVGAVRASLAGHELEAAAALAAQGAEAASPELRVQLWSMRGEALLWLGRSEQALEAAREALAAHPARDAHRAYALAVLLDACGLSGTQEGAEAALHELLSWEPEEGDAASRTVWLDAVARAAFAAQMLERRDLVDAALACADRALERAPCTDGLLAGRLAHARAARALTSGDLGLAAHLFARAGLDYERVGAERLAGAEQSNLAQVYLELGAHARAKPLFLAALDRAERQGSSYAASLARAGLASALAAGGELAVAKTELQRLVEAIAGQDPRVESSARAALADLERRTGDLEAAQAEAERALEVAATYELASASARVVLAAILLARGDAEAALEHSAIALQVAQRSSLEERDIELRAVHASILDALGRGQEADALRDTERERLADKARSISDDELRACFVRSLPAGLRVDIE